MPESKVDPLKRFADRVADYVKFRPSYPSGVIEILAAKYGLKTSSVVVDVGAGTGISTEIFLRNGNQVYAVEPNAGMREAADQMLGGNPDFSGRYKSVDGRSDATGLPSQVADFIIAAQAFHWFEPVATKQEFARILKSGGRVVLIWNDRKTTGSVFNSEYEKFIQRFATDYAQVNHKNIDNARIGAFLGEPFTVESFANNQVLDFEGLLGRVLSSSYMPNKDHLRFTEMRSALEVLFAQHQRDGKVTVEYDTKLYISKNA